VWVEASAPTTSMFHREAVIKGSSPTPIDRGTLRPMSGAGVFPTCRSRKTSQGGWVVIDRLLLIFFLQSGVQRGIPSGRGLGVSPKRNMSGRVGGKIQVPPFQNLASAVKQSSHWNTIPGIATSRDSSAYTEGQNYKWAVTTLTNVPDCWLSEDLYIKSNARVTR